PEDLAWMEESGLVVSPAQHCGVALPRDLMERVSPLGHVDWRTTLRSYVHVPWLWRSCYDKRNAMDHMARREVSFAMGVTLQAADKVAQLGKPNSARTAWLNHARTPRAVPSWDGEQTDPTLSRAHTWSALELDELF